jgi:hypothetical protein
MEGENQSSNEGSNGSPAYQQAIDLKNYHKWIFTAEEGGRSVRDQIDQAARTLIMRKKVTKP